MTDIELFECFRHNGFPVLQAVIMGAVALRESGGIPTAYNGDTQTGDDSYGLCQINWKVPQIRNLLAPHGITDKNQLFNPETNAKAAYILWDGKDRNLDVAWYIDHQGSTYKARYEGFLPRMITAARRSALSV